MTSGLAGCWHFDEGSGTTTADASGNGGTGTLSGSTLPSWIAGKVGSHALSFDGSSSTVQVADSAALEISGDMTITCWINPANVSAVSIALEKGSDTASDVTYGFGWNSDGKLAFVQANDFVATSSYVMVQNTWQFVCMVRATGAGTITYYVNGASQGAVSYSPGPGSNTAALGIGGRGAGASGIPFGGDLDDVRIYNRQLSASEITAIYNNLNSCP